MVYLVKSKADFKQQLEAAGEKLVVVDFFATWCGPCNKIAPKLEELAKQYTESAVVLKVNVDECEDIALEYQVNSMPTFVFIRNSDQIDTFTGANEERLSSYFAKHTSSA